MHRTVSDYSSSGSKAYSSRAFVSKGIPGGASDMKASDHTSYCSSYELS